MTYEELKEYALQYKNAMLDAGYIYVHTISDGYYECTKKGNDKTEAIADKHWRTAIRAESNDEPDDIIEVWAPCSLDNPNNGWTWYSLNNDPPSLPHLEEVITFLINAYELNIGEDYIDLDDLVL